MRSERPRTRQQAEATVCSMDSPVNLKRRRRWTGVIYYFTLHSDSKVGPNNVRSPRMTLTLACYIFLLLALSLSPSSSHHHVRALAASEVFLLFPFTVELKSLVLPSWIRQEQSLLPPLRRVARISRVVTAAAPP